MIKLFLRLSIAAGFLSAVADRLGWWGEKFSVWGSWDNFIAYTKLINPWFPENAIPAVGLLATVMEVVLAACLILGFRTELVAKLSGVLLLCFALAMTFAIGIKGAFDYSVFAASAAAFALSTMKSKSWELDNVI